MDTNSHECGVRLVGRARRARGAGSVGAHAKTPSSSSVGPSAPERITAAATTLLPLGCSFIFAPWRLERSGRAVFHFWANGRRTTHGHKFSRMRGQTGRACSPSARMPVPLGLTQSRKDAKALHRLDHAPDCHRRQRPCYRWGVHSSCALASCATGVRFLFLGQQEANHEWTRILTNAGSTGRACSPSLPVPLGLTQSRKDAKRYRLDPVHPSCHCGSNDLVTAGVFIHLCALAS